MRNKKRKIIIIISTLLIVLLLILPLTVSIIIYKNNFGERYETYTPMARSLNEFEGLKAERYTFNSNNGQQLVGYKYFKNIENIKGIVIIAHGLGGGGHNSYMDVADYLATNGYIVFGYDATGNDESEGDCVMGIPQGIIDLDYAIRFIKQTEEFSSYPIMLFGHSWGGYSAGSVLNLHPEVKAVVMVAGFNKSIDIIEEEGKRIAGDGIEVLLPYLSLIESINFGRYASYNCIDGFENTDAGVMIIHSADDNMISQVNSFDIFYNQYKSDSRFCFLKYEDRGHNYVYYSDIARQYKDEFNSKFEDYVNSLDEEFTTEIKAAYFEKNLDKQLLFDLDDELLNSIVKFYDDHIK